ncbi:transposase [Streptomyces sp. NPDC052036]|uniref:transposase n=1 Tax=unclassified Streptomyces TaxID=2593676 RepID=UPI003436E139
MKHYPAEFKAHAVVLVTVKQAAADLGVNAETLRNWIRAAGASRPRGRRAQALVQPFALLEAELAAARQRIGSANWKGNARPEHQMGWTLQVPMRRAAERDEAAMSRPTAARTPTRR